MENTDKTFMLVALGEAKKAYALQEVPIGAVIVQNGKIISKAFNNRNKTQNAINHAEILAISKACKKLDSWRIENACLYVTLQPCPMCMGAISNARIDRVVFGAKNNNFDGDITALIANDKCLNHKVQISGGILQEECGALITDFFANKRNKNKQ